MGARFDETGLTELGGVTLTADTHGPGSNMQFVECETVLFTNRSMAAVGLFEYDSSEESSPIRLGSSCARSSPPRKRAHCAAPPSTPGAYAALCAHLHNDDNDDDDVDDSIVIGEKYSSPGCEEIGASELRPANPPKRRHARCSDAPLTVDELLQKLNVVELYTSGYQNNCLWFSTQFASGQLGVQAQHSSEVREASIKGRDAIHKEVVCALPGCCTSNMDLSGPNDEWWAGYSRNKIENIFTFDLMMAEPHLFALANLLDRSIIVVDSRAQMAIVRYQPGYVVTPPLTVDEACKVRKNEPTSLWVRLHAEHFRALVPAVVDV